MKTYGTNPNTGDTNPATVQFGPRREQRRRRRIEEAELLALLGQPLKRPTVNVPRDFYTDSDDEQDEQ